MTTLSNPIKSPPASPRPVERRATIDGRKAVILFDGLVPLAGPSLYERVPVPNPLPWPIIELYADRLAFQTVKMLAGELLKHQPLPN